MATVTQTTQQVINALKQLATTSETAASNLSYLEAEFKKLASVNTNDFATWNTDIERFSAALKRMGMDSGQLKIVENNIKALGNSAKGLRFDNMSEGLKRSRAEMSAAMNEIKALYRSYDTIAGKGGGKNLFSQFTAITTRAEDQSFASQLSSNQATKLIQDYNRLQSLLAEIRRLQVSIAQQKEALQPYSAYQSARSEAEGRTTVGQRTDLSDGGADSDAVVVNDAFYKSLNMSSAATKNFRAQLEKMGVTGYTVTNNVDDLNSGLRNLRFQADSGAGGISQYTAVIDKAGNIVNTTQNRFRSFASGLARDVVEVLKWSIAIGAIYGPMRKLNELIEESKKIQADLIDVQISLGGSTTNLQNVFEASIAIANETSSAVEGVIEGYTAAVAAAGGAANEAQRLATTEILVRDSMVLAKLASIGQKEALDTLVGGLRQANLELTDGMQLLDSWVAVSRNANVSINQLATTFAIVGSGAEEVGLSYSELNGLAAVMAETTKLSADEVGNAIRGIIATLQSDTASQEFAKYGIATKTLTGDLRNMMDILKELSSLSDSGVLDEKAMGALTQAGGGGARRGAQLSALVQNMSRVMDVITVSEGASGDAADALELKMTTLESASQRLNNAFSALAQSLGMEGGIVDGLTAATNAFAGIVNGVKELVGILKWATPILAMSGIGKLLMGSQTGARMLGAQLPMGIASLFTPSFGMQQQSGNWLGTERNPVQGRDAVNGGFLTNAILSRMQRSGLGYTTNQQGDASYNTIGGFLGSMFGWAGKQRQFGRGSLSAMNMMVPAMMMGSTLMSGDADKGQRFGAQAAGTGIGMGLTALTGNAMWPMIGSIIATGFYEKFLTFEADIAKDWIAERERILDERTNATGSEDTTRTAADIEAELKASLSPWETFRVNTRKEIANAAAGVAGMWTAMFGGPQNMNSVSASLSQQDTMTQSAALLSLNLTGEALDPETKALIGELLNAAIVESVSGSLDGTSIGAIRTSNIEAVSSIAATAAEDLMSKALEDISQGASGSIQNYLNYSQAATQYATAGGSLITAQQQAGMEVMAPSDAVSFVSSLGADEAELLATVTTQIISGKAAIEELNSRISDGRASGASQDQLDAWTDSLASYTQQVEDAIRVLPGLQEALQQRTLVTSAESKLLDLVEVPEGLTAEQRSEIMARAEEMWREVLELSGLSEEEINAYIQAQKDQIVRANNEIYPELTKTPQNFISGAAEEQGYSGASSNWGFMDLRENYNQESFMSQLIPRYTQLVASFKRNFGDLYKPDISEDYGFILQDGFTTMDVDLKLLNLAMQDLVELTREKGLEGIYNLPAGATFMVPFSAFLLDQQTRNGMGGGGAVTTTEEEPIPYGEDRNLDQFPYRTGPRDREERLSISRDRSEAEIVAEEARQWAALAAYREAGPPTFARGIPHEVTDWDEKGGKNATGQIAAELTPFLDALSNIFRSIPRGAWEQFMPQTQTAPPVETSQTLTPAPVGISLSVDSNIQLVVDGRTLATIIKPFLYEDLIRFSASSPSNTNRSVVG